MKEEIQKLTHLQSIDSEIAELEKTIAKRRADIMARETGIAQRLETISHLKGKIEQLNQKQQETKAEHEEAGARIKDRQNKMIQVQTSREHQALLKEIEENKRLFKETEDKMLQFLEQIETLEQEANSQQNMCIGEQSILEEERDSAEKEIKRIEASKKTIINRRKEESTVVHPAHLKRYTMLLAKRDGLAVVAVEGTVCQGCHMSLPQQQVNEVRKADRLILCPTCQRILYFREQKEEATVED